MNPEQYNKLTETLLESVKKYDSVKGLVAVGSMAATDYPPDEHSDHDFFLITEKGHQNYFRENVEWLPDNNNIALHFRETEHGVKIVYRNGHLLEFAVFDPDELFLAKINRYRVLLNRIDLDERVEKIRNSTSGEVMNSVPDSRFLAGQFLTNILVGLERFRRGEHISANFFIKQSAIDNLIKLIILKIPSPDKSLLDNLNHRRRFEFVYPEIGSQISSLLSSPSDAAAFGLLGIYRNKVLQFMEDPFPGVIEILHNFR